jgi:hypothetical protein
MKIYGIKINHPHSGELTRSQAKTVLKHACENNAFGNVKTWDALTLKEKCEMLPHNVLNCSDVNYCISGELAINTEA